MKNSIVIIFRTKDERGERVITSVEVVYGPMTEGNARALALGYRTLNLHAEAFVMEET